MNRILLLLLISLITSSAFVSQGNSSVSQANGLIKVIILSGKNNHEWQKTTPLLNRIFKEAKLFTVTVTEKPDTLSYI